MEDLGKLAIRVIQSDAEDREKNGDYLPEISLPGQNFQ